MSTFKVQKIRSCGQCGDRLALNCDRCVKHPERKPRIIEIFNWPAILQVCQCKCSYLIQCQRDGCQEKMWREYRHTRGGMSKSANLFCSRRCNLMVLSKERDKRITVPCGYCSKPVLRKQSQIKAIKAAYCNPSHYFLAIRKSSYDEKLAKQKAIEEPTVGLLFCSSCRDVTEHNTPKRGPAVCSKCRVSRIQPSTGNREDVEGEIFRRI